MWLRREVLAARIHTMVTRAVVPLPAFINTKRTIMRLFTIALAILLTGCTGLPKGIEPVQSFELEPYLGKWYEIARLDHRFERGLSNVTAEYTPKESGGVVVKNRGYLASKEKWKEATGKAKFKSDESVGHLLVSFFGPIYGSYVIFELDNYQHAFISGSNTKSLWFLSRTPTVTDAKKEEFLSRAEELGFKVEELIWVDQSSPE